jgi:hypothetical protein
MFFGGIKIIFRKLHLGGNVSLLFYITIQFLTGVDAHEICSPERVEGRREKIYGQGTNRGRRHI